MVYCETEDDPRIVKKPCLMVEVLSDRTAETDRGEKWLNYQALPSLQRDVLLDPDTVRAEVFRRVEGGWHYEKIESGMLRLSCVDLEIALENLYSRYRVEGRRADRSHRKTRLRQVFERVAGINLV
jgi:Uma2 family endonuclease